MKMALGFETLREDTVGLTEVLETPMDRALILMLEGNGEKLGLIVISPPLLAAMVEMLTLAHLPPDDGGDIDARKPTRTDAAMVVDMIDAALTAFEAALAGSADWSMGYRYGAFIEDPRPLHLLLEDTDYHILRAEVHVEHGARSGGFLLALPAAASAGSVSAPIDSFFAAQEHALAAEFTQELAAQLADAPAQIDAVLARMSLPLDRILNLSVGELLELPLAGLDMITLRGIDGVRVGGGKLGQNRGMRAVRLTDAPANTSQNGAGLTAGAPQKDTLVAAGLASNNPDVAAQNPAALINADPPAAADAILLSA
jgi:flagellar motor switch protein FliM